MKGYNGSVQIRDAGKLWGLETAAAHNALRSELEDGRRRHGVKKFEGHRR